MTERRLKLGAMLHGVGTGWDNWKHPDAVADAGTNLEFYLEQARQAEDAKFDFGFVADSVYITPESTPHYLNRFEPLTILSALAMATKHLGLVATITVSYTQPYTVARQLASLDHISKGRAGWNVVTSFLEGTADNYSQAEHYPHDLRYQIADEFLEVTKGLWDSWEDDAFVRNKQTGTFYERGKLHTLNHKGAFFSVKGPLNISRSKQGQPVIFQAGMSEAGRDYAARHAEGIFCGVGGIDNAKAFFGDIKQRAAAYGRDPNHISVMPGINPIIAPTEEEAEEKYQQRLRLITLENALTSLGRPFNYYDFSKHDLDAPFPDLGQIGKESIRSTTEKVVQMAKERKMTLREVALESAIPRTPFIGTPEKVADLVQQWFEEEAADGFIIGPEASPSSLHDFTAYVVPILQERGVFRKDYTSDATLRDNLGLPVPLNRNTGKRIVKAEIGR
ncbi:FMN-dependent oxidoreductase, nitrilotriacetate monooxygenase family [Terribacillus halophilus]|uniref:FMN-dependent oxidoreductase, nitrilotriacetate monooxygenase family n=1 Tax=Terribacillus halophilus TaxID=361279 RepID=A0A1G6TA42_9BACI|nr:LLM class flavin-dependent oxidoreductase [Terribacillus halophilus]SDD25921.1 FMN-dependent oxidoreductase, nitrilotriacetate monooxygenase family [Terribacillus halophilus]